MKCSPTLKRTKRNPIANNLRAFRPQVVRSRKQYTRKVKHAKKAFTDSRD